MRKPSKIPHIGLYFLDLGQILLEPTLNYRESPWECGDVVFDV